MKLTILIAAGIAIAAALPGLCDDHTSSALERSPEGWTDLLAQAGSGLDGWTRAPLPAGGKLSPTSQWSFDSGTGILSCRGDGGHEWLRWDQKARDFIYHVEWRFAPVAGKKGYNSGIYVRNSADAALWHQAQTGDGSGGYLFGDTLVDGAKKRVNLSKQLLGRRVKPAGEWNVFEITCRGKDMTVWANGGVTSEWHECAVPDGYVGMEAEGWRIDFRNVKLKRLDGKASGNQ